MSKLIYSSGPGNSVLTGATWGDLDDDTREAIRARVRRVFGPTAGIYWEGERATVMRSDKFGTHIEGYLSKKVLSEVRS